MYADMLLLMLYVGYHTTCDNIFASLKLVQELIKKKTNCCGTVHQNQRKLPEVSRTKQQLHESKVLQHGESGITLTIYQCKPAKSVTIMSSLHRDVQVNALTRCLYTYNTCTCIQLMKILFRYHKTTT